MIFKYKIYCKTEAADKYWYLPSSNPPPRCCPNDSSHEVDLASVIVISTGDGPQEVVVSSQPAFASKTTTVSGGATKNLFKRFTGVSHQMTTGTNEFIWTQSQYNWVKLRGIEVVGGEVGDTCDLYVLDTATGTISGYPNIMLNQFAFNANIAPNFYQHESEYDADMIKGLQIKIVYKSISNKTVGFNFNLNEVK